MKIHLVSDLHLAFGDYQLPGGADLLIIAGDTIEAKQLKRATRFFQEEVSKYPQAILIMGNHEFYGMDMQDAKNAMRLALPANCVFLDNDCFEYGGWTFVGSTMWTDCNNSDPITLQALNYAINDYHSIKYTKEPYVRFRPELGVMLHKRAISFIDSAAKQSSNVFVVSHHAPTFASIHPNYANDKALNGGYASDLSSLILDNPNIKYWAHGHTHHAQDYLVGSCHVLCNPRGYIGHEACANGYEPLEFEIAET